MRGRTGHRRAPWTLGVNFAGALNVCGTLVTYLSFALALPIVFALAYSESVWPFAGAWAIALAVGLALQRVTSSRGTIGAREGFFVVSVTWLFAAAIGALPYLLSGDSQLAHPVDAYFEAMSGFTTTGSSILTDVEELNHSLEMWRQFTQWLGGMGIIVLALAVLPRLRVGGRQLLQSEMPGPEIEPLAARIRDVARQLWLLYVGLTVAMVAALSVGHWAGLDDKMTPYQALAHAFSTLPTGGFSTQGRSIEAFSGTSQWVIVLFMALAGANFALMYRALLRRKPMLVARDEEFRLYVLVLVVASAVVVLELWTEGFQRGEAAVRHGAFQVVSMMTTTGYASTDFATWSLLAGVVLLGLMLVGGSAGSTAGAIKVVRHLLVGKLLRRELRQTVHPELVASVHYNRQVVDERTLRAIFAFTMLYIGIFAAGTLLLIADAARVNLDLSLLDAAAAAATTLGNNGPAFGVAGPMGSFADFSDWSKGLMIGMMWLGRLELIPVVVLFTRNYWRA